MLSRKYCIVPECKNTTVTTPNKLFFYIPRDAQIREKWCKVMKRDEKTPLSSKSVLYCCEDHFDVETDMENYLKYQMMGGQLKLKKGVVPHKFACQGNKKTNLIERPVSKNRQIAFVEIELNPDSCHEKLMPQPEFIKCETTDSNNATDINLLGDNIPNALDCPNSKSVAMQVNIRTKYQSKATNTDVYKVPNLKPVIAGEATKMKNIK